MTMPGDVGVLQNLAMYTAPALALASYAIYKGRQWMYQTSAQINDLNTHLQNLDRRIRQIGQIGQQLILQQQGRNLPPAQGQVQGMDNNIMVQVVQDFHHAVRIFGRTIESLYQRKPSKTFWSWLRFQYNPINDFNGLADAKSFLGGLGYLGTQLYGKWVVVPKVITIFGTKITGLGENPTVIDLTNKTCSLPYAAPWCMNELVTGWQLLVQAIPMITRYAAQGTVYVATKTAEEGAQVAKDGLRNIGTSLGETLKQGLNNTVDTFKEMLTGSSTVEQSVNSAAYRAAFGIPMTTSNGPDFSHLEAPFNADYKGEAAQHAEHALPTIASLVMSCALVYLIGSSIANFFKVEEKDKK